MKRACMVAITTASPEQHSLLACSVTARLAILG